MFDRAPDWLRNLYMGGLAAWALVGILVLAYLVGQGLLYVRVAIPPILIALITIYVLAPAVHRLHAVRIPRPLGVLAIYVTFVSLLVFAGIVLAPVIVREVEDLIDAAPQYLERIQVVAADFQLWLEGRGVVVDVPGLVEAAGGGTGALIDQIGRVTRVVTGAIAFLFAFLLGLVIAFYVLMDLPRLQRSALRLVSDSARERLMPVLRDVSWAVGAFVRGQLLIGVIVGVLSTIALLVLDIPNAVAIGVIAGISNLIPFVGPIVGGAIAVVVAWVSRGVIPAVSVLVAFTIIQQLESHLISPNIMRRAVRIHPATAIVAIFLGAVVAGVWGMLLAIPVVAGGKAAVTRLWFPHLLDERAVQADERQLQADERQLQADERRAARTDEPDEPSGHNDDDQEGAEPLPDR